MPKKDATQVLGRRPVMLDEALAARCSTRDFRDEPIGKAALSRLAEVGGATRYDSPGRAAPSAHARYPIRLRITAGRVHDLATGVWRADGDIEHWHRVAEGDRRQALAHAALGDQPWVGEAAAVITLCADLEACRRAFTSQPPTGERGSRYAWIESGAIAQNVALVATALGLGSVLVAGFDDDATADVLVLGNSLQPLLHICVGLPVT